MAERWRSRGGMLAAGSLAVLCGCLLLMMLGAPSRMPLMNAAALMIGLVVAQLLWLARGADSRSADAALLGAGLLMPLTAIIGPEAEGVARWLVIGGLTIQPGMLVAPLVVIGLAARPTIFRLTAVGLAALGTVIQPDLGTASMLACGLLAAGARSRTSVGSIAALLGVAAAAVAFARSIELPPVAFVEHVFADAIAAGPGAALVAIAAALLMFVPALAMRSTSSGGVAAAFAGVWAGGLLAALAGPYPTPVIGFGGSAVVGYVISVVLLTLQPQGVRFRVTAGPGDAADEDGHTSLRTA